MVEKLSYRPVEESDFEKICRFPQNSEELFFMFPKAEFPLTIDQLKVAVGSRYDSTVILCNEEIAAFANFYEVKEKEYCSIGNVIVHPDSRHKGIGEFLISTMERIGAEKYQVNELHLSCFNTNTKGILLYSKLGYQPYEIEKWLNSENELLALVKLKRKI